MSDCNREGHEITIARDGIGYCRRCDDWHDLESLRPQKRPQPVSDLPPRSRGSRDSAQRAQLVPDAG